MSNQTVFIDSSDLVRLINATAHVRKEDVCIVYGCPRGVRETEMRFQAMRLCWLKYAVWLLSRPHLLASVCDIASHRRQNPRTGFLTPRNSSLDAGESKRSPCEENGWHRLDKSWKSQASLASCDIASHQRQQPRTGMQTPTSPSPRAEES